MRMRRSRAGSVPGGFLLAMAFLVTACSGSGASQQPPGLPTQTIAPASTAAPTSTRTPVPPTSSPSATPTAAASNEPLSMTTLRELTGFVEYEVNGTPDWQAVSKDAVWVADDFAHQIYRIDPSHNKLTSLDVGFGPCNGMAVGFSALWTADCFGKKLVRIGLDTRKVDGRLDTPIASGGEGLVAAGEGYVWIVGQPGTLLAVHPRTMKVAARVAVPQGATSVAVGLGATWVADPDQGTVSRVDPVAFKVVATVDVGGSPRFLTAGEDAIWVLNQADGTVARIDPATNQVTATVDARSGGEGGCIAAGAGSVWTTTFARPLTRIDEGTGTIVDDFIGGQYGDCLSVAFDSVWLSNLRSGTIWRLPLAGLDGLADG